MKLQVYVAPDGSLEVWEIVLVGDADFPMLHVQPGILAGTDENYLCNATPEGLGRELLGDL